MGFIWRNDPNEPKPVHTIDDAFHAGVIKIVAHGRHLITQEALRRYQDKVAELCHLHTVLEQTLAADGVDIEPGLLDAGIFAEEDKSPNWRGELVKRLGQDVVKEILDATAPKTYHRMRIFPSDHAPEKGIRIAPLERAVAEAATRETKIYRRKAASAN